MADAARARALRRPRDSDAQLAYLSLLYRLNRNEELVNHVQGGRASSSRQVQDLAAAAGAKLAVARAQSEGGKAGDGADGMVPPPRPSVAAQASGYYPPPGGWGGYPPPPPGGWGGYPPGYGAPPPPPGGWGGYPPPGGAPPSGGGYGSPPPPPSSSSGRAASSNRWDDRQDDDGDEDDDDDDERHRRGGRPGTSRNPLIVQTVSRFGWREALRLVLSGVVWLGIIAGVMYFMRGSVGGGAGGAGGGIQSLLMPNSSDDEDEVPDTRFTDVVGVDEAKTELQDVVEYLQNPQRFAQVGARIPKGVLLSGPPGTGKTLLARAVAGEAGVKFFARSASEFEEMLVGLGARRVREIFDKAKKEAPAIIFIDEIDAMGAKRGRNPLGSGAERQTLNQLLACMDGFSKSDNVIVIAATNNPEILDSALVRPGRFDSRVDVPLPDVRGRKAILDLYLSKVPTEDGIDASLLAAATPGMSGAAIATMVNSAAIAAAKAGRTSINAEDLEEARDKTWMGPAMRSRRRTLAEMELTAYHEGGHTLAGLLTADAQELHKVTILPRGPAGGVTFFLEDDNAMTTRAQLLARLDVAMGGRVAEELIYGHDRVTTGASSDMQNASRIARAYVKRFSMGANALATYSDDDGAVSEAVRARIDGEVEALLSASYERVTTLLTANRPMLDRLAKALLEHETLTADECRAVAIEGRTLPPPVEMAAQRRSAAIKRAESRARAIQAEDDAVSAVRAGTPPPAAEAGGGGITGMLGAVFGSGGSAKPAEPAASEPPTEAAGEPGGEDAKDKPRRKRRWV